VARGWTVLMVNPAAGERYEEKFYTANAGAWGDDDDDAFHEPIDSLIVEGVVDNRLAVAGCSYGGFTTC